MKILKTISKQDSPMRNNLSNNTRKSGSKADNKIRRDKNRNNKNFNHKNLDLLNEKLLEYSSKMCNVHKFFEVFANPLRINIIFLLIHKEEMNVCDISKLLKEEQSKVSHALGVLRKCHFVHTKRIGRNIYYMLNKESVLSLFETIKIHIQKKCDYNFKKRNKKDKRCDENE